MLFRSHLVLNKEILGSQLASFHNLNFYLWLVREAKNNILNDTFEQWKSKIILKINTKL